MSEYSDHKVLIAYHANCIDGFTAAWVVWNYHTEELEYAEENIIAVPVQYQEEHTAIRDALEEHGEAITQLYIVDFSLTPEAMTELSEACPWLKITMLDHHRTAMEMWSGNPDREFYARSEPVVFNYTVWIDQRESGASLTWKYLFDTDDVPELIKYVRDYDLWKFEYPETKGLNKVFRLTKQTWENWEELYYDLEHHELSTELVNKGQAVQQYYESIVVQLATSAEQITLAGEVGFAVNCPPAFASDVGHILATASGTFGACWHQEKGEVKFSLRSNGDYDVAAIAKNFGGGGHKNAAGFKLGAPSPELFPDSDSETGVTLWRI